MHLSRIAALLQPFLVSDQLLSIETLSHISTYIDILQRWNARINLTALRDEDEIVTRHFGESIFLARHLFPGPFLITAADQPEKATKESVQPAKTSLADLGSGAGFPGIPIKLWAPCVHVTLIESNHKKATFLKEIVRALTLTNIDIRSDRAEIIQETFDVVTLRAVERFIEILPTAARLVANSGRLAMLIGSSQVFQAETSLPAFQFAEPIPLPSSKSRIAVIAIRRPEPQI